MKGWERWGFHTASSLITLSGLLLFAFKYLWAPDDPFSIVSHPLEPVSLKVHLLAAPLMVFVVGAILVSHVRLKLATERSRNLASGKVLIWTVAAMTSSGYLLQVVSQSTIRLFLLIIHCGSAVLFLSGYGRHLLISRRRQFFRRIPASAAGKEAA